MHIFEGLGSLQRSSSSRISATIEIDKLVPTHMLTTSVLLSYKHPEIP